MLKKIGKLGFVTKTLHSPCLISLANSSQMKHSYYK